MKVWERIFLYSVIVIMAFHLFLVDSKVESQVRVQEEIRAKRIVIMNDEGQPVVILWAYEEGGGVVSIYNRDGAGGINMGAYKEDGGRIDIYNKAGTPVVGIGTTVGERGFIGISNDIGNTVVGMTHTDEGHGGIYVFDRDRKPLDSLP